MTRAEWYRGSEPDSALDPPKPEFPAAQHDWSFRMAPIRILRPIEIVGDTAFILLSQNLTATIDAEDVSLICHLSWYALRGRTTYYAAASTLAVAGKRQTVQLHRVLLAAPVDTLVDHENGNGLDCKRSNIRLATRAENSRNRRIGRDNTSGLKGASFDRTKGRWQAQIRVSGRQIPLGLFDTPELAHDAYAEASRRFHGSFGRLK